MEYLDHPALIEEWKQKIYVTAYENNLNQDVKIPSIKKTCYRNNKPEYWPTIIKESLNWLPFIYIMEFALDRIDNDKLLPSLLKLFSMFNINFWYSPGEDGKKNTGENIYKV